LHEDLVFYILNDRFIISFKRSCHFLQLLNIHDMHMNDEYESHIMNITTLEISWSISEHLKQTLKSDASKSQFPSLVINE